MTLYHNVTTDIHTVEIAKKYIESLARPHKTWESCERLHGTVEMNIIKNWQQFQDVKDGNTGYEIHAIAKYFHETESRQSEGRPKKGKEKIPSESDDNLEPDPQSEKEEILSDSERINEPPVEKTAKATGKSTDTISKINQIMEAKEIRSDSERINDRPQPYAVGNIGFRSWQRKVLG